MCRMAGPDRTTDQCYLAFWHHCSHLCFSTAVMSCQLHVHGRKRISGEIDNTCAPYVGNKKCIVFWGVFVIHNGRGTKAGLRTQIMLHLISSAWNTEPFFAFEMSPFGPLCLALDILCCSNAWWELLHPIQWTKNIPLTDAVNSWWLLNETSFDCLVLNEKSNSNLFH